MRLVRQYGPQKAILAGRFLLLTVFVGTMYALISVSVNAVAHSYIDAAFRQQDQTLLDKSINSDLDQPVGVRIANREALLGKMRDRSAIARLTKQVAALYEREGSDRMRRGDRSSAEMDFRKASQLDPGNPSYYYDTAQLYADDAVEQHASNNRAELYRNSLDLYSRALVIERDPYRRQKISEDAASASYDLAKVEFVGPAGKSLAIQDLQRARQWVTPGTQAAEDIDQLFLLASN